MRRVVLLVLVISFLLPATATAQVAESLRKEINIRESLLATQLRELAETREDLREVWTRLEQQTGGLLQAQRDGESVDSLRLRDEDIRKAESELLAGLFEAQQQRSAILENRNMIAAIEVEVERLESAIGGPDAPLSGAWRFVVEPGQEGVAYIQQQGTLVSGTYSLSGGFTGSFRGTFVAGKVRLERIDSQYGFAAIFYGRLVGRGPNSRLQGNWEATQLASGLPSAGSWSARRIVDEE
jgi:hypothetical protein